jgi:hypothetical protein
VENTENIVQYPSLQHYVNYPEVQEIILGSSAAYTQTNFINNNFNSFYGRVHPKSVYNDVINDNLIQDLRSLTRFSSWQRSHSARQIATFLVGLNNLPEVARTPVEQLKLLFMKFVCVYAADDPRIISCTSG